MQRNTISGSAALSGVTVQASQVHGGIHTHVAGQPRPVPRQLPPAAPHFTGRDRELRALDALRESGDRQAPGLVVITGAAGIGKTTLATHWLHSLREEFPDGQFYADLRGHTADGVAPPGEVLAQFLRALEAGSAPADLAEQAALWRSLTTGRRIAVLLDNAYTAAQVRPLLPAGESSVTAVTCRRRLTGLRTDGAAFHPLGLLGSDAATRLLARGIGEQRMEDDSDAARQVVTLCAGLPLALCLVSARLAARPRQPVRAMAEALAQEQERLTVLRVEGEREVRSVLDESCMALEPGAASVYRRLGLLSLPTFDSRVAAAACGLQRQEAADRLDALVEANLLEDCGPDIYRFHDLVRLHARESAVQEGEAADDEVFGAVCDMLLARVAAAERLLVPARQPLARDHAAPDHLVPEFADSAEALTWLEGQRTNLMWLVRAAARRQYHRATWQLVDAMWPLFLRLRHYEQWIEAHELGLTAARAAQDPCAERQMLTSGAAGLSAAGKLADAIDWYRQALVAARAGGVQRAEGQALLGLGACEYESGRGEEGAPYLHEAIAIWEGIGYVRGASLARIVLGEIALEQGFPERALLLFETAHTTLRTINDPHDEARALAFLGFARARSGEAARGVEELSRALAVFREAGSAHWQGRALEMLGSSAQDNGEDDAAREYYEQAAGVWRGISTKDAGRVSARISSLPNQQARGDNRDRTLGDSSGSTRTVRGSTPPGPD